MKQYLDVFSMPQIWSGMKSESSSTDSCIPAISGVLADKTVADFQACLPLVAVDAVDDRSTAICFFGVIIIAVKQE